jgi:pyruvate/2-oxoglutarate dehydrogenase complex dihydrolipoamide acyltransferase (E2) component
MKALREKFGEGVRARKPWVSEQVTVLVNEVAAKKEEEAPKKDDAPEKPAPAAAAPAAAAAAPAAAAPAASAPAAAEKEEGATPVIQGVALEGLWVSSVGKAMLVCKGRGVTFVNSGTKYALAVSEGGDACTMDGWTLLPESSNASTLRWEKDGETISWEFEGTVDEAPPIGESQPAS